MAAGLPRRIIKVYHTTIYVFPDICYFPFI